MSIVTSMTLLERVKKNDDSHAWSRFYDLYSPLIFGFARQRGCNQNTAEEVLQETMYQLVRHLPKFTYDRSRGQFSTYVCTIVRSVIRKHISRNKSSVSLDQLFEDAQTEAPDPESLSFFDEFEKRRKVNILRQALVGIKKRLEPLTWKSFELFVLNGKHSGEEVAAKLGIDRNAVYQHKNRVIHLLKEEARRLEQEIGDSNCSVDVSETEYSAIEFSTLIMEPEWPSDDVKKRFKFLQKAFDNHPPPPTDRAQVLVVTSGNSRWLPITKNFTIGSNKRNQLQLKSNFISKRHALISCNDRQWLFKDLGSTNGVSINGNKITERFLNDGDIIQLGNVILIFTAGNTKV